MPGTHVISDRTGEVPSCSSTVQRLDIALEEKRLSIEETDPLLLYGFNDAHIRKIESAFDDVEIVARGNELVIRGDEEQIDRIERAINELIVILNRNSHLTENDVDTVLDVVTLGNGKTHTPTDEVILHTHTGDAVKAQTPGQLRLVHAAQDHDVVFTIGPAGTGKTYTAVALAVAALQANQVNRIVLSRPAVEAGEELGFLPGDFHDKVDPYLRPLYDALYDMIPRERLAQFMDQHTIEIVPLAYMRGRTLNSSFVILDEAQNATAGQMKMFLTRLGAHSRAIITGDVTQTDLPQHKTNGLIQASHILEDVNGIEFVHLDRGDVVRHQLVKDILNAYESFDGDEKG